MAEGWIKLHRKLQDNPLWLSEPFTRGQAWIDLLLLANHDYGYFFLRGNKIEINRGEIARGEDNLATRWKWSRGKVRGFLKQLENEQQIEQQKSNIINKIIIINYDAHQKEDSRMNNRKTAERQQNEQQKDTNKNENNNKNEKKEEYIGDFENFWNRYGKIGNKQNALKTFNKIKGVEYGTVIEGLERYQAYCRNIGQEQKYIKHASTWLNCRGWEDEYTITTGIQPQQSSKIDRGKAACLEGLRQYEASLE